ncbi:MAG TPA: amidophosphoribosyltransferase [Candidatus Nitrosopolaris sp.]|nr:amidophosphoribosyltransferase [Candidatus Nitrosopolaris sp.]
MVHENCGVVGAFSLNGANVVPFVIDSLRALQHRGQESWGFAVPNRIPLKKLGLVSAAAPEFQTLVNKYESHAAIGHVRYSTFGKSTLQNAQPLKVKDLCVAHNGTIANVEELTPMVGGCTFTPQTMSDTLVAAQRLVMHATEKSNFTEAVSLLRDEMVGSFCFTFLTDSGCVYAARDPKGFRPLVMGYHKETNTHIVASESCAFSAIGAQLRRDVEPGEIIKMSLSGIESEQFSVDLPHSHCAFEYTYFAHPSSIMEGVNVYAARSRIGRFLAKEFPVPDADVVVPVPDSARPAALGYALEIGIPFEEGLLKDRYSRRGSMRSFIEPDQESRIEINKGIIPIREVIDGKNVVVVDDSIVRGNSSISIIRTLHAAGAKRINMIITYPPIRYPCYAGIDFPSQEELLAFRHSSNDMSGTEAGVNISKIIGADYVAFNSTTNLAKAIGIPKEDLCFTCSTGDYSALGIKPIFKSRKQMKGED